MYDPMGHPAYTVRPMTVRPMGVSGLTLRAFVYRTKKELT